MKRKLILHMILAMSLVPLVLGICGMFYFAMAEEIEAGSIDIQMVKQDVALEQSNGIIQIVAVNKEVSLELTAEVTSIAYNPIVQIDNINIDHNGSESKGEIIIASLEAAPAVTPKPEPIAKDTPTAKGPEFETSPVALKTDRFPDSRSTALIQAPLTKPGFNRFGEISTPVVIDLRNMHLDRINNRAPIMNIEGIGTSIWTRGPPVDTREILSSLNTNFHPENLSQAHLELVAPYLYIGNTNNFVQLAGALR